MRLDFRHEPVAEAVRELSEATAQIREIRRTGAVFLFGGQKFINQLAECACAIAGLKVWQIERDRVRYGFTEFRKLFCVVSFADQTLVVLQLGKRLSSLFSFKETPRALPVAFEVHHKF